MDNEKAGVWVGLPPELAAAVPPLPFARLSREQAAATAALEGELLRRNDRHERHGRIRWVLAGAKGQGLVQVQVHLVGAGGRRGASSAAPT